MERGIVAGAVLLGSVHAETAQAWARPIVNRTIDLPNGGLIRIIVGAERFVFPNGSLEIPSSGDVTVSIPDRVEISRGFDITDRIQNAQNRIFCAVNPNSC